MSTFLTLIYFCDIIYSEFKPTAVFLGAGVFILKMNLNIIKLVFFVGIGLMLCPYSEVEVAEAATREDWLTAEKVNLIKNAGVSEVEPEA